MNDKKRSALERRRLRLLYSLSDLQIALSAATFLAECEPEELYTKIELRRFRCYETTAIMAYTRPFSESKGEVPQLGFKMIGAALSDEQKALHQRLLELRNQVVAHSDSKMMRMLSRAHSIRLDDGFEFVTLETVFDEGLHFSGRDLRALSDLILVVSHAVCTTLFEEAQTQPSEFNLLKDYLKT
jgi:hypothetical protein